MNIAIRFNEFLFRLPDTLYYLGEISKLGYKLTILVGNNKERNFVLGLNLNNFEITDSDIPNINNFLGDKDIIVDFDYKNVSIFVGLVKNILIYPTKLFKRKGNESIIIVCSWWQIYDYIWNEVR